MMRSFVSASFRLKRTLAGLFTKRPPPDRPQGTFSPSFCQK
jgi:hypothetical protein